MCKSVKYGIFIFLFLIAMISEGVFSADPSSPATVDERIVSTTNPIYYCFSADHRFASGKKPSIDEMEVISRFGYVDVDRLEAQFTSKSGSLGLHPKIVELFDKKLVPHYRANPYIGSDLSSTGRPPSGWFGGISMTTLTFLDDLIKVQATLPAGKHMKFLGVGSGNAFLEFLLSHIGLTTAMDVVRPESSFMRVTICEPRGAGDDARIVAETFPDANYADTVLVLSWPRDFAIPYIHKFLEKGGRAVLFVRNEAVDSIFDHTHLGEISEALPNFKFKTYLRTFRNCSLPLNTATFSTVDLYWKGKQKPPIANAIEAVKARLGK
ncbi:MAG: hypothetical protein NT128_00975 [Proteobacteria bacterium]|nr:hypothetical protein [Pseudomonadota bacterium]